MRKTYQLFGSSNYSSYLAKNMRCPLVKKNLLRSIDEIKCSFAFKEISEDGEIFIYLMITLRPRLMYTPFLACLTLTRCPLRS